MPIIELLVIQPTPFCNIDCRYCYLPDRNSRAVVAPETLCNLFSQVFASGWVRDCLSVVWHAGEPLVLPVEFYQNAFRTIEALKPAELPLVHSFQTNGTLIDAAWCEFFAEQHVNVGVSIDGPKRLHDRNRLTRAGRGTFDKTIAGIRLLRQYGVPFHVISVLSLDSMLAPGEMFDFYVAEGIQQVCFNVEESEGAHVSQSFADSSVEAAYYRFLSEFWRLSAAMPGKITFIREIEHALQQVIRPKDAPFSNQLVEPFSITSMDWAGHISTFSPELLGLKNALYGNFLLGNINHDALVDMPRQANFARMLEDIEAGVAMCRESCEYFSVCGGGEPVNKLAENGTFVSTETTYCRLTKMRATDLVLDALERVPPSAPDRITPDAPRIETPALAHDQSVRWE
ncbi:MAG TPA: cyclophane-forming radical SAM/SPASM peptide maturase GrrM/OscB [Stellaceae bacterium]|nr:cyclophane-forming radical SAM/SPASM peptide maturase GrrM/OscB [Stellaceae bacterium]